MKVLVLDLTHGGEVLAEEYASRGDQVTAIDVYRNSGNRKNALEAKGVRVLDTAPAEDFDLAVAPIHCPDRFLGPATAKRRITHHQAIGELVSFTYPVIEVTGARAKTSTCHVLAHMLSASGAKVLMLTSRGIFSVANGTTTVLEERSSIAPPTVLRLAKMKGDFGFGVFEISLGGTGLGDISLITTLGDNYPIAAGTRRAFDGKVQMVAQSKGTVVLPQGEMDIWENWIPQGVKIMTFGGGGSVEMSMPRSLDLGKPAELSARFDGRSHHVKLPGSYLSPSYLTAFAAALTAVQGLKIDPIQALNSLKSFNGVPGRGEVSKETGWYLVRDRNPGVSAESIDWNLTTLEEHYGQEDIGIIIDPVNHKVCEKLDINELEVVMRMHHSVKGAYLIARNCPVLSDRFQRIDEASDVRGKHKVLLWCTKEGYQ